VSTSIAKKDAAKSAEPSLLSSLTSKEFYMRNREFMLVYLGYVVILLVRNNYGFWMPDYRAELNASKAEVGMIGTYKQLGYAGGALINGPFIDYSNPAKIFGVALMIAGGINIGIMGATSVQLVAILWGLNGLVQSVGWPSLTKVFLAWFPDPKTRGTAYSFLSTSQNVGAFLVPVFVPAAMATMGWRGGLLVPGVIAIIYGVVLVLFLYGSPATASGAASTTPKGTPKKATAPKPAKPAAPFSELLIGHVLFNYRLWLMTLNYYCISVIRQSVTDWGPTLLKEEKGLSVVEAGTCMFLLEAGGFLGSIAAGILSDKVFDGRRGPVISLCTFLLSPCFIALPIVTSTYALFAIFFGIGFCAFPPHMMLGLFSREIVPDHAKSTAGGFNRAFAQLGGAMAGGPLGAYQERNGWTAVFTVWNVAAVAGGAFMLPLYWTNAYEKPNTPKSKKNE
jgi:OPA family sugar phosphate sensor protein UhpC-like MFS transporter